MLFPTSCSGVLGWKGLGQDPAGSFAKLVLLCMLCCVFVSRGGLLSQDPLTLPSQTLYTHTEHQPPMIPMPVLPSRCSFLLGWFWQEVDDRNARNGALSESDKVDLEHLRERGAEMDSININWIGRDLARWMIDDRLMELLFSAEFLHTETLKR